MPTKPPTKKRRTNGATRQRNSLGQFVNSPGPGRKKGQPNKVTVALQPREAS